MSILERDKLLVELGCGNGRDSILFAEQGIQVKVIDQSEIAIKNLEAHGHKNIECIQGSFVNSNILLENTLD